jgi:DNA-binding protein
METKRTNSDNVIMIGAKPFMNYVTGVVVQFTTKEAKKVTVMSRGKFISKAVDVAEVARRKFLEGKDIVVENVRIGSESFENKEGKNVSVSTIEIDLVNKS